MNLKFMEVRECMRRFLRLLGNLGIMILAVIAYALVQGL